MIDLTVIIPAYYGSKVISDCVKSVQQALQGKRGEIIVVESSGDSTSEILRRDFPDVRLVQSLQPLSAGAARNAGVLHARGRLLFFVDQDCLVPENWISVLEKHLQAPGVGAAGGSIGIRDLSNLSGCAVYFLEFFTHFPQNLPPQKNTNFLLGANMACRAKLFQFIAFPDQTIGEDVLFTHAIRSRDLDLIYDPALTVLHRNREGWDEFFRYSYKLGIAAAAYQEILQRPLIKPFLKFPVLVFLAPIVNLIRVFVGLLGSDRRYLARFILLLPMCLAGNLVWATAFRRGVLASRQKHETAVPSASMN